MVSQKVTASLQDDKGTWTVRGRVYDPVADRVRQRTRSTGLKVKDNTKRKAKEMMKQIVEQWQEEADRVERVETPPFSEYVQRFIHRQVAKKLKANTIKSYQDYIKCHINPKLGSIPINELRLEDLEQFYSDFLETHKVNSARKIHVVIKGAIKEAIRDGIFQYNIADSVEFPRGEKYTGARAYNEEELNILFEAAKEYGEPERAGITLAVCYGLRRSEVVGLRWKDIDFEHNCLTVSNTVVQNGSLCIEEERTKTAKSHRTLALLPVTVPYLKELRERQRALHLNTDKVVAWENGEKVRPDFIYRKAKELMQKSGLPSIRFHDLRHTAQTILALYVRPEQSRDFLGHENISTTFDVYTHVLDEQKKETSEKYNEALKNVSIL